MLLPELGAFLSDDTEQQTAAWRLFQAVDQVVKKGAQLDDIVLTAVMLLEPLLEACDGTSDRVEAAFDFMEPVVGRLHVPRRIADAVRRVAAMLPRLEAGRPGRFARTALYPLARQVYALRARARGIDVEENFEPVKLPPPRRSRRSR